MISEAHATEFLAQCDAVLAVLQTAGVRLCAPEDAARPQDTGVTVLPALTALQISWGGRARFRRTLAREDSYPERRFWCDARGQAWLVLPLTDIFPMLHFSKHPVGMHAAIWQCEVEVALAAHGWYDPGSEHRVPAGRELDAIEVQSAARERYRAVWGTSWEETWGQPLEGEEQQTHGQ